MIKIRSGYFHWKLWTGDFFFKFFFVLGGRVSRGLNLIAKLQETYLEALYKHFLCQAFVKLNFLL